MMIEVNAILFILLSEGFVVLLLILIGLVVFKIKRDSKDKAAAKKLVSAIKKNASDREKAIMTYIEESAGLQEDELTQATKVIDVQEKEFFTQLIRLYIKKDSEQFAKMGELFDQVIESYKSHAGKASNPEEAAEPVAVNEEDASDLEALHLANQRLEIELNITKSTMANMMDEFNLLFSGGQDIDKEKLKAKVESAAKEILNDDMPLGNEESTDIEDLIAETIGVEAEKESSEVAEEPTIEIADEPTVEIPAEAAAETALDEAPADKEKSEKKPEPVKKPAEKEKKPDDFSDIVTSADVDDILGVDDILDSIDLSKEIDV